MVITCKRKDFFCVTLARRKITQRDIVEKIYNLNLHTFNLNHEIKSPRIWIVKATREISGLQYIRGILSDSCKRSLNKGLALQSDYFCSYFYRLKNDLSMLVMIAIEIGFYSYHVKYDFSRHVLLAL